MSTETLSSGSRVLHGQYTLLEPLSTGVPNSWLARNEFDLQFLLKIWPYAQENPDPVVRASWDRELRYLFRLSSAPESETRLVVLRDAGLDPKNRAFVMVLAAPGYRTLDRLLASRKDHEWLREIQTLSVRLALWKGLRQLALGLTHLHEQQMLHRHIHTRSVYADPDLGPESMRLGGFEWAIKVGGPAGSYRAPELEDGGGQSVHTFESDWFAFGALAAQILVAGPHSSDPDYNQLLDAINSSQNLSFDEASLLLRLLDDQPESRLSHGFDVISAMDRIIYALDEPRKLMPGCALGVVLALGVGSHLTRAIIAEEPTLNAMDIEGQRKFVEHDLRSGRIAHKPNSNAGAFILLGNRLGYEIVEYSGPGTKRKGHWDLAYCARYADLRYSGGYEDQRDLKASAIRVFTSTAVRKDASFVFANTISWQRFLPRPSVQRRLEERQQRFHDFFRFTNQVELVLRDAEIFRYRILTHAKQDGTDTITICEIARGRKVPSFAQITGGMVEFLRRQMAETAEGDRVYLGTEDSLFLSRRDKAEFWKITDINVSDKTVTLERVSLQLPVPESEGFLRAFDLFGEMSLIRRRKRAIERLRKHSFLLESLQRPDLVYIDTGLTDLPLPIDPERLDPAKDRALHQIWRTRPIYALQGPPGTGKTTLVAHLLGLIFKDDPVAQILVTAQAHAAVDVLRAKVNAEIFREAHSDDQPLSIRLPRSKGQPDEDPDSVPRVTLRMLQRAEELIQERSEIEKNWLEFVRKAITSLNAGGVIGGPASGLCELVRRSANITYSSTTAGNLEELADSTLSFDWSIIEEAGKAHGFDLVLPLQTGHRWLLIGDQNQLPPYRHRDFQEALRNIDDVVDALAELPDRGGGLVDMDLVLRWKMLDAQQNEESESPLKEEYRREWREWLMTFKKIHDACAEATGSKGASASERTPLSSMLSHQHRMHPTIADLISAAYYRDPLVSDTKINGVPIPRVVHDFRSPKVIISKSILWLDVPWVDDGGKGEIGPPRHLPYIAPQEVEAISQLIQTLRTGDDSLQLKLAILSPYRQQVKHLQMTLPQIISDPPKWMFISPGQRQIASTVDSYQGNQADVVVVSLVRNNNLPPGEGLGFLAESPRMNVLFSRAEKLLILVGSWRFFQNQLKNVAADANQPIGHWKIALDFLQESFERGTAAKLDMSELEKS